MKRYFVLSAVVHDRTGFVNRLATVTTISGGSIEHQRSARMAGVYALLMLVSFGEDEEAKDRWITIPIPPPSRATCSFA